MSGTNLFVQLADHRELYAIKDLSAGILIEQLRTYLTLMAGIGIVRSFLPLRL